MRRIGSNRNEVGFMRTIATSVCAIKHAAALVEIWAAHGSPMVVMGCARQPFVELWGAHAHGRQPRGVQVDDGRMKTCSPRKETLYSKQM